MTKNSRFFRPLLMVVLGILTTGIICAGYASRPVFLTSFQNTVDDLLLRSASDGLRSERIAIVDIDENSLKKFGQWPWPRTVLAELIDAIASQDPLCVVLDMLFAESDRTNSSNDAVLAQSLARVPVLLGYQFLAHSEDANPKDCLLLPLHITLAVPSGNPKITLDLLTARSISCALPQLSAASVSEGFLNVFPDNDGVIREVPLVMGWQSKLYPSLGLATALFVLKDPSVTLHVSRNGVEQLELRTQSPPSERIIPLDQYGQLNVNYRGKAKTFPYISALDLMDHNRRGDFFNKKIVFVGTSAAGLSDLRTSPLGTNIPGVEIQATVTDNVLQGDCLRRPNDASGLELGVLLATGLLASLVCAFLSSGWRLGVILLFGCGIWFGAGHLASAYHYFLSPFYPCLCLLAVYLMLSLFPNRKSSLQTR